MPTDDYSAYYHHSSSSYDHGASHHDHRNDNNHGCTSNDCRTQPRICHPHGEYSWGRSEGVASLQEVLGIRADGEYGPKTREAHQQALAYLGVEYDFPLARGRPRARPRLLPQRPGRLPQRLRCLPPPPRRLPSSRVRAGRTTELCYSLPPLLAAALYCCRSSKPVSQSWLPTWLLRGMIGTLHTELLEISVELRGIEPLAPCLQSVSNRPAVSVAVQIPRDFRGCVPLVSMTVRRGVSSLAPHLAPQKMPAPQGCCW